MIEELPFSPAAERNKAPILEILRALFDTTGTVLEIGCGTGQHAEHFAAALPHLVWQASDHPASLPDCEQRLRQAALPNLPPPLPLDVTAVDWPTLELAAAFSANTAHIMSWPAVVRMFAGLGRLLPAGSCFCLYGPFSYGGRHTSESNRLFDRDLRRRAAHMGIRDLDELTALAAAEGFGLEADHAMPANNRLLVWRRS